jgi:hypothetical protein
MIMYHVLSLPNLMILQFPLICEIKLHTAYKWRLMISNDNDNDNKVTFSTATIN